MTKASLLFFSIGDSPGLMALTVEVNPQTGRRYAYLDHHRLEAVEDRVSGLDLGADDYLLKPFEVRELTARMRALIRRRAGRATSTLAAGGVELDAETHELRYGDAKAVLSAREYALMHALMERPGRILSRQQLEERIYGWGEEVESNAVDVLIHSVRRKFGKTIILNVRGAGWMLPKS